jgi:cytochrome P450
MSTGPIFMFSLGNIQILHMNDPEVVKEISICTSLDFGKPSYQSKEHGPLFGQGILTSNGATWAHQRKILAPELYMEKVKVYIYASNRTYMATLFFLTNMN